MSNSWVTPELMVQKTRSFSELRTDKGWIFWLERRPEEGGRSVVVGRSPLGEIYDLTPGDAQVGTRVHEYGGGAWVARVIEKGIQVVFSDVRRGGIWSSINGEEACCWCSGGNGKGVAFRYADLVFFREQIICIREGKTSSLEYSEVVSISPSGEQKSIKCGDDFYSSPRLSSDGQFLAGIAWQNPQMPWTETHLWVVHLEEGSSTIVHGEQGLCSVMEPSWDGDVLYALSDHSEVMNDRHWTPIAYQFSSGRWRQLLLPPSPVEVGLPAWVFGQRSCVPLGKGTLLARGIEGGHGVVLHYTPDQGWNKISFKGAPENVPLPVDERAEAFAWIDTSFDAPPALAYGTLDQDTVYFRHAWSLPAAVAPDDVALPMSIECPVSDGPGPLHAFFYAPASGEQCVVPDKKPPLVVIVHGGPTGSARTELSFKVQWWTSRGFAVLDVNYRGSTGFGRAYREALDGQWGIRDVQDCCGAVQTIIERGLVDPKRCVIRGSSAGGLTVLSALAHSNLFVAGTSLYGVTDLRGLVAETHRFEARYLDSLVAPWPEGEVLYKERSPVSWPEKITSPVLFLHGDKDNVVPLKQAETLCQSLSHSELHIYPDEGHGFRHPDVVSDSLLRELRFYRRVFGG